MDVKKFEEEYDVLIDYEDYTNLINTNNKDLLCVLNNTFVSGKDLFKNYESIQSIKELENTADHLNLNLIRMWEKKMD